MELLGLDGHENLYARLALVKPNGGPLNARNRHPLIRVRLLDLLNRLAEHWFSFAHMQAKKIPRKQDSGDSLSECYLQFCIETHLTVVEPLVTTLSADTYSTSDFTTSVTVKVKVVPLDGFFTSFELSATCPLAFVTP